MENLQIPSKGKLVGSEKIFGNIIGIAGIVAIIAFLFYIAPVLTKAFNNGVDLIGAGLTFALSIGIPLVILVFVWKNRNMFTYAYNIAIKYVWKSMIEANPIAAMENAWDNWSKQAENLNKTITLLESKEKEVQNKMEQKRKEANQYFKEGKKAQALAVEADETLKDDFKDTALSNSIMAQRRKDTIDILKPKLETILAAKEYCQKIYKGWRRDLALLKDDIDCKKDDLSILKSISGAFDTAKSIIDGNSNERAQYEEAVSAYGKKVADYVGKCKRFTEQAKDWVMNKEIQSAIETEEGQKFLEMYDEVKFNELTDFNTLRKDSPKRGSIAESSNRLQESLDNPMNFKGFDDLP